MTAFRRFTTLSMLMISVSMLFGCGKGQSEEQHGAGTVASATAASSSVAGATRSDVAPGLSMEISSSARTSRVTTYTDGRKSVSYDVESEDGPYTVIVEFYEHGEKDATNVFNVEKKALADDGISAEEKEFSVDNGKNSRRLDWSQEATTPWSSEETPPSISLDCSAVFFDGSNGYSYAVYVSGDAKNSNSRSQVQLILGTIAVAEQ